MQTRGAEVLSAAEEGTRQVGRAQAEPSAALGLLALEATGSRFAALLATAPRARVLNTTHCELALQAPDLM